MILAKKNGSNVIILSLNAMSEDKNPSQGHFVVDLNCWFCINQNFAKSRELAYDFLVNNMKCLPTMYGRNKLKKD